MQKLLQVRNLKKYFPIQKGILQKTVGHVKAVDGVSFDVYRGETVGLVGESGCGKTTTGRCIMRLVEPTEGSVLFGREAVDLCQLSKTALRPFRRRIQMIFQDPFSSLNPRMTVSDIVAEPLRVQSRQGFSNADYPSIEEHVVDLLESVGLKSDDMRRYPHAFSGGQRQRIGIARALALRPDLIIADEPVSSLDVSIQSQILNLLQELKEKFQLSYLFIAHDLSVVEHISDRVAVMYLGKIVELSSAENLYTKPQHPYTEALISAVPVPNPKQQRQRQRIRLSGDVPDPSNPPSGCRFHPRCQYVQEVCHQEEPVAGETSDFDEVMAICHFRTELDLRGVS
ncbi:MAG: ABC transporter ATP-binding protein [Candidatus Poribacteria bacterium]|jgi:oligopeptide/dipeptide ABC transporter ATP-binding protein|nr:ABC transporter ATP-binding protein [Candidatus Poribacteria bacterium]MDP6997084.1 ABC transporter ATP-binding protein [Candidatus Poribacteria bacterium]